MFCGERWNLLHLPFIHSIWVRESIGGHSWEQLERLESQTSENQVLVTAMDLEIQISWAAVSFLQTKQAFQRTHEVGGLVLGSMGKIFRWLELQLLPEE